MLAKKTAPKVKDNAKRCKEKKGGNLLKKTV